MLYVGGEGGRLPLHRRRRELAAVPSAEPNSLPTTPTPPGDGGGLPIADVSDLDLALGKIDPTTGRPVAVAGRPEPPGRDLRPRRLRHPLAPLVQTNLLALDPQNPARGGSDTGASSTDKITNDPNPFIVGYSQQSAFGTTVRITLFDLTDPANPVYIGGFGRATTRPASLGQTDANGRFVHLDPNTGSVP